MILFIHLMNHCSYERVTRTIKVVLVLAQVMIKVGLERFIKYLLFSCDCEYIITRLIQMWGD